MLLFSVLTTSKLAWQQQLLLYWSQTSCPAEAHTNCRTLFMDEWKRGGAWADELPQYHWQRRQAGVGAKLCLKGEKTALNPTAVKTPTPDRSPPPGNVPFYFPLLQFFSLSPSSSSSSQPTWPLLKEITLIVWIRRVCCKPKGSIWIQTVGLCI